MNVTEAWQKITGTDTQVGRAGWIPVYDGEWRAFRSTYTIWPGMENSSDPAKVDKLRQNVIELMAAFDRTLPELDRLGIKIKALLNKPIRTPQDVDQWANSIFNTGPVLGLPAHVTDAEALKYDKLKIVVQSGRHPQYVLPASPYEEGSKPGMTVNFNVPGSRLKYGPRHEFSKAAWSLQAPVTPQNPTKRYRGLLDENGAQRPRGRPRKDGLTPGSKEAKAADVQKKRDLQRAKAERERERRKLAKAKRPVRIEKPSTNGEATITQLPTRRVLARVGGESA